MQKEGSMREEVRKAEVQEILGFSITDEQFEEALACAHRKQQYIYDCEARAATLQHGYLVKLTEECVRSLAFSHYTLDLCRIIHNMEKEHPADARMLPMRLPIL